jgi:hypothetical protein
MTNPVNSLYSALSGGVPGGTNAAMYQQVMTAFPELDAVAYMARSVTLPPRVTGAGSPVRRDNGIFVAPGYTEPLGHVEVTFIHELATTYKGSAIWALLTAWRAVARAGMGPDFPTSDDLTLPLVGPWCEPGTLNPNYRFNFVVTMLAPTTGNGKGGGSVRLPGSPTESGAPSTLSAGPGYVIVNAWPTSFGVEPLNYDTGNKTWEIKASFQCDDVLPDVA